MNNNKNNKEIKKYIKWWMKLEWKNEKINILPCILHTNTEDDLEKKKKKG